MSEKCRFLFKVIAFFVTLFSLIIIINNILTPKKYYDDYWTTTATYKGFYQMNYDSTDVLFLGSSHAASCFNPQIIYNKYGIKSYNLSCAQQNILVSYYWLKEAIKYQSPKVIVLDTYMLFEYIHGEALNTSEQHTRLAIDPMRWSNVKYEAVKAICDNDKKQTFGSYIFKNIRFHTRWTNLSEQDFILRNSDIHYELKGYSPLSNKNDNVSREYNPISDYETDISIEPVPLMSKYLDEMVKLCYENDIRLILVKTPTISWNAAEHNYIAQYAEDNRVDFIDFNARDIYDVCEFEYLEDMNDNDHCNLWGSEKISLYLADILINKYDVACNCHDEQWENTNEYFQSIVADCELKYLTDLDKYIDALNQDRYTVLLSTRYDMMFCLNDNVKDCFSRLGLDLNAGQYNSYYAAISDCNTVQLSDSNLLKYAGSTHNKLQNFTIVSGGFEAGAQSSIKIGDVEYSRNINGINIVVYNEESRTVVDSVVYDGTLHR